jgi:hypothetical protein
MTPGSIRCYGIGCRLKNFQIKCFKGIHLKGFKSQPNANQLP